jgi:hypothetical protein
MNLVHWISDFCLWISSPSCPTHVLDLNSVSYGWVILFDFYSQSFLRSRSGLASVLLRFFVSPRIFGPPARFPLWFYCCCCEFFGSGCSLLFSPFFFCLGPAACTQVSAGFPLQVSLGSVNFPAGPVSAGQDWFSTKEFSAALEQFARQEFVFFPSIVMCFRCLWFSPACLIFRSLVVAAGQILWLLPPMSRAALIFPALHFLVCRQSHTLPECPVGFGACVLLPAWFHSVFAWFGS